MKVQCRKYRPEDFNELLNLINELGYPLTADELNENLTSYQKKGGQLFVSTRNNEVLGCVTVIISASIAEGIYGEIKSLVVSKKARGLGLGTLLTSEAEKWVGEQVDKIRVRTNATREGAHMFYEKRGYEQIKTQKVFFKAI